MVEESMEIDEVMDIKLARYHKEAIPLAEVGEKFRDADKNRDMIGKYFETLKVLFGESSGSSTKALSSSAKYEKCVVKGCLLFVNMKQVEEISRSASQVIASLAEQYHQDMFYIGISQNAEQRGREHNIAKGKTSNWTEQIILVLRMPNFEVLGCLEHEILDKASRLIDSRRFKNDMPGGGYAPINKRAGDVCLLRFADQFGIAEAAAKPKDFSGGPRAFQHNNSKLAYPPLTLPKIKERASVYTALRMMGYVMEERIPLEEKLRGALYKCDNFPLSFHMKHHLVAHLSIHIPNVEKCTLCKFKTRYHSNFRKHMKVKHHTEMKKKTLKFDLYICEICNKQFQNDPDLQSHRRVHNEAKYQFCGRLMKKGSLLTHNKSAHPTEK